MTTPRRPVRSYDEEDREKKKKKPVRTRALNMLEGQVTEGAHASLARDPTSQAYRRQERYARGDYPIASAEESVIERTLKRILGIP